MREPFTVNPTIVVVAYRRVDSLRRLLDSLANTHYLGQVHLVISIDVGAASSPR